MLQVSKLAESQDVIQQLPQWLWQPEQLAVTCPKLRAPWSWWHETSGDQAKESEGGSDKQQECTVTAAVEKHTSLLKPSLLSTELALWYCKKGVRPEQCLQKCPALPTSYQSKTFSVDFYHPNTSFNLLKYKKDEGFVLGLLILLYRTTRLKLRSSDLSLTLRMDLYLRHTREADWNHLHWQSRQRWGTTARGLRVIWTGDRKEIIQNLQRPHNFIFYMIKLDVAGR